MQDVPGQVLPFESLHRIATVTAGTVPALFDDVYQAAWVRFVRYVPQHYAGAWMMARSARTDVCRRDAYQQKVLAHAPEEAYFPDTDDGLDAEIRNAAVAELAALVNATASPTSLRLLANHASGRRRLSDADFEHHRAQVMVAVKARTNGHLAPLLARAFR